MSYHKRRRGSGGGAGAAVASYVTNLSSTANNTSYTFASANIGAAAADRLVVVSAFGDAYPHSLTIGGNAATLIAGQTAMALYYLLVAAGTTADIVVSNFNGTGISSFSCGIGIFNIKSQLSDVPSDFFTDRGNPLSSDAVVDGTALIGCCASSGVGAVFGWTNAIEQFDTRPESRSHSGAIENGISTPVTVEAAASAGFCDLVVAAWN